MSGAEPELKRTPGVASWTTRLFGASVSPWSYALLRVGLASIVLARTTDWLAPLFDMDHHGWVLGLDHVESIEQPALHSPLFAALPPLSEPLCLVLGLVRTTLAFLLLLGVRPRLSAALLAVCGYVLMASDRYHYFHHLHLLWVGVALFAFAPSDARLSIMPITARESHVARLAARWPLMLVRAQVLVAYAAAGLAKLSPAWLSGQVLSFLVQERLVVGPLGELVTSHPQLAARIVAASELALVPMLLHPRTRAAGLVLALALHIGVESSMRVSTFGMTMLVLCTAFLPWAESESESESESGSDSESDPQFPATELLFGTPVRNSRPPCSLLLNPTGGAAPEPPHVEISLKIRTPHRRCSP